ncbi:glycyl-tRNA synthetase, beta subunit [Anopheles sinensis]|uniref:Glycyl-tRNA synthetase, beta subunit n=1 Tax=Anopheles sinensis TaxID=74873 RepID=A0A084VXF2_ANOSI|nr:glycyl-tRNA synthetase, beta subunit [Anopheles sinensis]
MGQIPAKSARAAILFSKLVTITVKLILVYQCATASLSSTTQPQRRRVREITRPKVIDLWHACASAAEIVNHSRATPNCTVLSGPLGVWQTTCNNAPTMHFTAQKQD